MITEDEFYFRKMRKHSLEEKIIAAWEEERAPMSKWEIQEVVEEALSALPFDLGEDEVLSIYDVLYDTIVKVLERTR